MKILATGDFHGKFPKKFEKIIVKEKIDLVVSVGDYLPFFYRKLWFKHCYGKDVELWEVIGKKRYIKFVKEDLRKGEEAIKKLNALKVPVFTVLGNVDYSEPDDIIDLKDYFMGRKEKLSIDEKERFAKIIGKYGNIKRFDYSYLVFGDYIFIGMRGHSNRGKPRSKNFIKHKKKLERLFERFRKENRDGKVIFVSHNVPFNTRLDKISNKAHKAVRGKHLGSKLARTIISRFQPLLSIGGHIHEGRGKDKIGKTICVNTGSAHEGQAVIIEINGKKVNSKFI